MSGAGGAGAGGGAAVGGVGGTTFAALSGIGSDISVSVSFNIATELLDAAHDEQLSDEELISLILGFTIVFSALQSATRKALAQRAVDAQKSARTLAAGKLLPWLREAMWAESTASASAQVLVASKGLSASSKRSVEEELLVAQARSFVKEAEQEALSKLKDRRSALDFAALAVDIVQRILVAVSIQLLAASVRSQQPSRLVRMISLCGLAVFFVFVESLTHRVVM